MKKLYVLLTSLLFTFSLFGQDNILKVEQGSDLAKVVDKRQYLFPEFMDGILLYKIGNNGSKGKFNYNKLLNEFHFLNDDKVLTLANPNDVLIVIINSRSFVNVGKGFAEVIAEGGTTQLAVRRNIKFSKPPTGGGYGIRSETAAVDNYSELDIPGSTSSVRGISPKSVSKLSVEVELQEDNTFYFIENGKARIADKKSIFKTFSKHKNQIEAFLKNNNTNFKEENDLKVLFTYCAGL